MKKTFLNNKTILITGGAGFIGSHLCEELLKLGAKVICFDNFSQSSPKNISFLSKNKNFKVIKGDCNKFKDLEKVFKENRIDYVFHYAAVVGVRRTQENPLKVLKDIEGIKNVLGLSIIYKAKKVVFASSSEVYGESRELPEKEDGPINPRIPYAQVKLVGESLFRSYYEKYNLSTTSLRFFNAYGPRQESSSYGFVVGIFIKQALKNKNLTVVGDGKMTRDFVFVKDNVRLAIEALVSEKTNGEIINIGTGKSTRVIDLAKIVIKITNSKSKIKFIPQRNKFEIKFRQPDITRMKRLLGNKQGLTLEKGLIETIKWYRHENI